MKIITESPYVLENDGPLVSNTESQCVFIIPENAKPGDIYIIVGYGEGGWRVQQNEDQVIFYEGYLSTRGPEGGIM